MTYPSFNSHSRIYLELIYLNISRFSSFHNLRIISTKLWNPLLPYLLGCMGGDYYTHTGGGTNHLCIPKVPKYDQYKDCYQDHGGFVFGTEYKLSFKKNLHNHDAPCAVCYVESCGSMPMMLARNDRPSGWSKEYHGYLVTEHYNHKNQKKTTSVSTETLSLFPAAARTQMEHCCTL